MTGASLCATTSKVDAFPNPMAVNKTVKKVANAGMKDDGSSEPMPVRIITATVKVKRSCTFAQI